MNPELLKQFPTPTQADKIELLFRLYFGKIPVKGELRARVDRAYLDMNRTLHKFAGFSDAGGLRKEAHALACRILTEFKDSADNLDLNQFDEKHKKSCESLCLLYKERGFESFTIGQAQKWINMSFKYIYLFGEKRITGFAPLYDFAHVPLDRVMLSAFERNFAHFAPPSLPWNWSRIPCYEKYIDYQRWIRKTFPGSAPLAVEFWLWQAADPNDFPDLSGLL